MHGMMGRTEMFPMCVDHKIWLFWGCILFIYTMNCFRYYSIENTFKILKYPNYFIFNSKQKVRQIFQNQNQRMNDTKNVTNQNTLNYLSTLSVQFKIIYFSLT